MYTLWDLLGVIVADIVCIWCRQIPLLIFVNACYSSISDKPLEIDPYLLLDTNRKSYMGNSAVLLDLTLSMSDLESQNPYQISFSTQTPQNQV